MWMKTDKKTTSKPRKDRISAVSKKVIESSDANVSVFTKTTTPKVIIKSENIDSNNTFQNINRSKHKLLKFICSIIMCLIILMTFFLSLKTYDTVNELSKYFM